MKEDAFWELVNKNTEYRDFLFEGACHDCGKETIVTYHLNDEGDKIEAISGGAIYSDDRYPNPKTTSGLYFKCFKCFDKDEVLKNYVPCEVFKRVVGYYQPVSNWNKGKKAEEKLRKNFNIDKLNLEEK